MSLTYKLGISSVDAVTLRPEYQSRPKNRKMIASSHRARSGSAYRYIWSLYDKQTVVLDYVPASDASLINSWWESGTNLLFFITSDTATEVHSVQIVNPDTPLNTFTKPYNNLYKGKIELEGY